MAKEVANEFNYTLEEAYDKIRILYEFKNSIFKLYQSIGIIENGANYDYQTGYNDAVHRFSNGIEEIYDKYANSVIIFEKKVITKSKKD